MQKYNIKVQYKTTTEWKEITNHGLLLAAWQFAKQSGAFEQWEQVKYKMKKVIYSPLDKLKTLWASIVVGCNHTVEINDKLGKHEASLARAVGLPSFPDQSQIDRLLLATQASQVEQWRQAHLQLLARHSRAKARSRWQRLANGERMLVVDLDQRALAVLGKSFELAKGGYFGRKRGKRGYQLSAMFMGGQIGELVDEYLDPGDNRLPTRVPDLLQTLLWLCKRLGIEPSQVLLRSDAELGTAAQIELVKEAGFHYLFKGLSPQRAKKLADKAVDAFWRAKAGSENQQRWISDLGIIEHIDQSAKVKGKGKKIESRTLIEVSSRAPKQPLPHQHRKRVSEVKRRISYDYYLTDLTPQQLPVEEVLPLYDDRVTIERYFYDEQYSLGAQQVRTKHFEGEALFQFLVATTNNLLRWMQHRVFRQTELERIGLGRLIRKAMQIPGRIRQEHSKWIVELPLQHYLVRLLAQSWAALAAPSDP